MKNYKGLEIKAHPDLHKTIMDIINKLKIDKNSNILVLASGTGSFDLRLFDNGFRNITSVEINEDGYKNDKNRLLKFLKIDLNKDFSEYIDGKYDLIIGLEIIEHLYNPYKFLGNCKKLLKDNNSYLIISTPNLHNIFSRINFLLLGYPNYFIVKPNLYDHVSPIFDNIFEHYTDLLSIKIEKKIFTNYFLKHFKYHSIKTIIYYTILIILLPFAYFLSLFNRYNLFGVSTIYLLKNK